MMASLLYLGIVTSRGHRGTITAASVRPLLVSSEDRKRWARDLSDLSARKEEFPNGGFVSWLHPEEAAAEGTLWQFEITEQPTYFDHPDDPKRDQFMVLQRSARPVYEVLDVDRLGGEPAGRELLTVHGMRFPKGAPAACFVRAEKCLWSVPPLRFVKKACPGNLWIIDLSASSGVIRWVKWEEAVEPTEFEYHGTRLVLPPDTSPVGTAHKRDWSQDEVVLARVFRTLRKVDRHHLEPLEPAERAVARLAQLLSEPEPAVQDIDFEAARVRRARTFLEQLKGVQELARAASVAIENGPVAEEIARRKEDILDEERSAARAKVETELADERSKLQELSEQVAKQEGILGELKRAIEVTRAEHEAQVGRLEEDLARRVREAVEKPEELLGSVALIRAITAGAGKKEHVRHPQGPRPVTGGVPPAGAECTSAAEVFSRLQKAFLRRDIPRVLARSLHASFLAGAVPLLAGSRAQEALSAYASCVTAGRFCWVPVSAAWLDPTDFLGRVEPDSGRFLPHACGLLDVLLEARADDRLHLVVLDGVNRAAVESYLIPLLECHADAGTSRGRSYPLVGSNGCTADIDLPPDGRLPWPPNVLLAGTLALGSTSLPLPRDLWGHATLHLCDAVDPGPELEAFADLHPDERLSGRGEECLSFVRGPTWAGWQSECRGRTLTPCVQLWAKLARENDLPRSVRDVALRFFAASRTLADDPAATADTLAHCLLPLIARDADRASAALGDAMTIYGDWSRAIGEAARLTMT
jgi:hypothetical protein